MIPYIKTNIVALENQKETLIEYLCVKAEAEDRHAVADAAMDLRDLEAAKEVYLQMDKVLTKDWDEPHGR